jgi:hypothetical protein
MKNAGSSAGWPLRWESFSAMQIRLRELDLLEYHPLDEYVEKNLLGGKADERLYL